MLFMSEPKMRMLVVCAAGERRPYGCFIFIKGVIGPDGEVI